VVLKLLPAPHYTHYIVLWVWNGKMSSANFVKKLSKPPFFKKKKLLLRPYLSKSCKLLERKMKFLNQSKAKKHHFQAKMVPLGHH
jgi:hypothetical protein